MRAHSQRRLIWILNLALGVALLAVGAWFALDVRKALAQPEYLKPAFADGAVAAFQSLPDGESSGPPLAVEQKELDEIDVPAFKQNGRRFHWLYSGPRPPEPPKIEKVEGPKAPVISDLEKLGSVHMMIYIPPRRGETIASESVVVWRFAGAGAKTVVEEFRPGQFIVEPVPPPAEGRGNIRLANVLPRGGGLYELVYEVYEKAYGLEEVPDGEPLSTGSYAYDGRPAVDKDLQDRILIRPSPAAGGSQGSGAGEAAPSGAGSTAVVPATPGTAAEGAPAEVAVEAPDVADIQPTVTWENARRARVQFDQATSDYFRGRDAQDVAKTLKTQVAKDAQGNALGLQVTGLSDDSPARKFDIRRGDILVSIDGRAVASRDDAVNIIQRMDPNVRSVTVVILRDGKEITYVIDPQDDKTRRDARYLENAR